MGVLRPCRDPPSLVVQEGKNTPHQRGHSSKLLVRLIGKSFGRIRADLIPSRGFQIDSYTRLALCALEHPFREYSRHACSVCSWLNLSVAPLGEQGCQIGHLGESVVEFRLPIVPGSNLESFARAQYNHFLGQAQLLDLPFG